jgi:hypothetical protein
MIAPDRVVVRDSPAIRNHCVEPGKLGAQWLAIKSAALAECVDREIRRGTVGINMREAAGDLALAASRLKDRVLGRGLDFIVEFLLDRTE